MMWFYKIFIIGIFCVCYGGWVFVIDIYIIKFVFMDYFNCRCCKFFNCCVVDGIISIGGYSVEVIISYMVIICIKVIAGFGLFVDRD